MARGLHRRVRPPPTLGAATSATEPRRLPAAARRCRPDDRAGAADTTADARALEEQQAHRRIALRVAVPELPGIVGRIGQAVRRALARCAPPQAAEHRTLSRHGTFAAFTGTTWEPN